MDEEKDLSELNTPEAEDAPSPSDEVLEDVAPSESDEGDDFAPSDDLDIESALASVANLSATITDTTEMLTLDVPAPKSAPKETPPPVFTSDFPRPPLLVLERGQLPSVIPALALMGIGAGLTFLLITGAETLNTALIGVLALGGVCVMLMLVWLAMGRWGRGALFLALCVLSTAGILVALPQTTFGMAGLPLLLCGWGASVIISGLLSPKRTSQGFFGGLLLMVMGGVMFSITAGIVPENITALITSYGAIAGGMAGALLFLPAIFKRRR